MPFSSNFTKVTRAVDNGRDVLFVEGKTEESEQVVGHQRALVPPEGVEQPFLWGQTLRVEAA